MIELIPLTITYVNGFNYDQEKIKSFVQKDWVPLEVFRLVYHTMVNKKEIEPIESLPEDEKKRLKAIMKVWGTGDVKHQMTQVRVIHLIEEMMSNKIQL